MQSARVSCMGPPGRSHGAGILTKSLNPPPGGAASSKFPTRPVAHCGGLRFFWAQAETVGNMITSSPRVEPAAKRQFQYLCRWFAATAHATLQRTLHKEA